MAEKFVLVVTLLSALSALGGACWLKNGAPPRTPRGVFLQLVFDVAVLVAGVWVLGSGGWHA